LTKLLPLVAVVAKNKNLFAVSRDPSIRAAHSPSSSASE